MKAPVRVAVTGAAGQIGYALLFRIASGEMQADQRSSCSCWNCRSTRPSRPEGVMMELEDCAFPLLAGMVGTDDAEVAFKDADIALLVGVRAARAWAQGPAAGKRQDLHRPGRGAEQGRQP